MDSEQQRSILNQSHAGAQAINFVHGLAAGGTLGLQTRLRIGLYLARRGHCVYPLNALLASGRAAGMNGAEMEANMAGTSHDAKATACLAFVAAIASNDAAPTAGQLRAMATAGYTQDETLEVIAQTGMHALLARLCAVIATPDATVNCSQLDSQILPAD